jgi:outer membrane protein assembly factor BamB
MLYTLARHLAAEFGEEFTMRTTGFMTTGFMTMVLFAALAAGPAFAQAAPKLSPEAKADSDGLRSIAAETPALPLERVEIKLTPPTLLGDISAMTTDKQGNIYIFHRPKEGTLQDPVVVVDSKGKFLRAFGKGMNPMAHGIKIDPAGNVWTIDAHTSMVRKFTPQGKLLLEVSVGDIPDPNRAFCGATDIAFKKDGHFYIADGYCNARFIEYDAQGKKVREWGKKGKGPGEFQLAHDVSVAADGTIFVADRENGRVQWFDPDGKYLGEKHFGGQLFSAQVAANGMVYVGTHARGVDYPVDSNVFEFDPKSGKIIGRVETFAHQLTVGADGTLYPGLVTIHVGNDPETTSIVVYRPKK